jgi:hypothetical protein
MSLLSEVMTPFRGLGGSCRRVARKIRSRDLPAGFGVIIKGVAALIARGVRAGWAASGPKPPPAEKPAKEGEEAPDPSKIKKEKAAGEKPTPKGPSAADRAEAAGVMVLCAVIGFATLGTALATLGTRLASYLPAAGAVAVPAVLIAAWIVAPQKARKTAAAPSPQALIERDRRALYRLLDQATARRNGVHLGELHELTSAHPLFHTVPKTHLTLLLDAFGVPWERSLSVDGIGGRTGVRRTAVEALLKDPSPAPVAAPSRDTESAADLRVHGGEEARSSVALGPLSGGV